MDLRTRLRALESRLGVGSATGRPAVAPDRREAGAAVDEPRVADGDGETVAEARDFAPKPSLAARLQRLAAREAPAAQRRPDLAAIARSLGGEACADGVVLVERMLPLSHVHGRVPFARVCEAPLDFFAGGVEPDRAKLLFIDTETTGLSGGTGTVAFVLGLARIRGPSV